MSDLLTVDGLPIAPGLRLTIAWIGGLSRLPTSSKDFLVEVALRATGEGAERFLAQVALGDLVYLFPGTTWEQQHRVRLRRRTERQVRLDL